jgi:hypothetical protein
MKKTTTKLQLKKSTIRLLDVGELADVNGGAPTNQQIMCSMSCNCPPKSLPPGPPGCHP